MRTHSSPLSTNKIVILLAFLCVAIMSSVFVFHLRNKVNQELISTENNIVFTIPREIKPFDLISADNNSFKIKDFLNHWTLLAFGFSHCASVCPANLDLLKHVYAKLHGTYPSLQIVFVSLDQQRDTPEVINHYVQSFNPNFIGVTGKIQDVRKLQSQLGIYSEQAETPDANYQIQHTSTILLIDPQAKWAGVFRYGLTPAQFSQAFEQSVKVLGNA